MSASRLLLLACVTTLLASCNAATTARADEPLVPDAAQTLTECVQRAHTLLVDVQMDRSISLSRTDRGNRRVDGLDAALTGLSRLATRTRDNGHPLDVQVLLGSFAGSERTLGDWQPLSDATLDSLVLTTLRYRRLNRDRDTDYVVALRSAREALLSRATAIRKRGEPVPCKMIVFFTDGRYELGVRSGRAGEQAEVPYARGIPLTSPKRTKAAVDRGRHLLCRRDGHGVMDTIADDGTVLFTVALSTAGFKARDRNWLANLTRGGGRRPCGRDVSRRTGAFFKVDTASDLLLVLSGLVGASGPVTEAFVCPYRPCPKGTRTLEAVGGLRHVALDASAHGAGLSMSLTDPTGHTTTFPATTSPRLVVHRRRLVGTQFVQRWIAGRSFLLDGRFPRTRGPWEGTWRFAWVDPSGEQLLPLDYRLHFTADEQPAFDGDPDLLVGETATIAIHLVDHAGTPLAPGPLTRATHLSAVVSDALNHAQDSRVTSHGDGTYAVRVPVPRETLQDGHWHVALRTRATLGDGIVTPASVTLELPMPHRPAGLPGWLPALAAALALLAAAAAGAIVRRARFVPPQRVLAMACQAKVVPRLEVVLPHDPGELGPRAFRPLVAGGTDKRVRRIEHPGPVLFRRRLGRPPFLHPYGEATAGGRQLLGADANGRPLPLRQGRTVCRVPLALPGSWLFAIDVLEDDYVEGQLLVFASSTALRGRDELVKSARDALRVQQWTGFEARPRRRERPSVRAQAASAPTPRREGPRRLKDY